MNPSPSATCFGLHDRAAPRTGAAPGIGAACAWRPARAGVRANAVGPGTVATGLAAQAVLASDASSHVTGEISAVDDGRKAPNDTAPT